MKTIDNLALEVAREYTDKQYQLMYSLEDIFGKFAHRFVEKLAKQEPVAWMYQHEETGLVGFVDQYQIDNGFKERNPRLQCYTPLYAAPVIKQTNVECEFYSPDGICEVKYLKKATGPEMDEFSKKLKEVSEKDWMDAGFGTVKESVIEQEPIRLQDGSNAACGYIGENQYKATPQPSPIYALRLRNLGVWW